MEVGIEEATIMTEKVILRSKERREATAKKNIGKAGVGAKIKQERGEVGVEIVKKRREGAGAEVGKEIEIEIGGIGVKAKRRTEIEKEEREGIEVLAGKEEKGQEIGVQVPVMTEENAVQEAEIEIRKLQMALESSWQLQNLRLER